jgi:plastocyanin
MRLIAYKPHSLKVPAGTTVMWKQQDAGFHTVTSGTVEKQASGSVKPAPDGVFDSGRLAKGEQFTFTFKDSGNYDYFCRIHPATMSGRVEVE